MTIVEKESVDISDIVQYMIDTRCIIGLPTIKVHDRKEYWIACAINELFTEVGHCFPWEMWKHDFPVNYTSARLEAIDVLMHLITATYFCEEHEVIHPLIFAMYTRFRDDPREDRYQFSIYAQQIVHLLTTRSITSVTVRNVVEKLCTLTHMSYDLFELYVMTKCCFLRQRIKNGVYVPGWGKTNILGETEDMTLTELIEKHLSNPSSTMKEHLERVAQCANLFIR